MQKVSPCALSVAQEVKNLVFQLETLSWSFLPHLNEQLSP
jgi:hypothetical protein